MTHPRVIEAMQFLQSKGLTDFQAAGLVGTWMQESGPSLDPAAAGDPDPKTKAKTSFGIYQARKDRFARLKRNAAARGVSWKDFQVQLDTAWQELNTSEKATLIRLKASTNLRDAAAAAIGFERPKGWTAGNPTKGHGWTSRLSYAQEVMGDKTATAGGEVKRKEPVIDPEAKDDLIPGAEGEIIEPVLGGEEDPFYTDPYDYDPDATYDDTVEDEEEEPEFEYADPPGPMEVGNLADIYPQEVDDTGFPDPPQGFEEFAQYEALPPVPTTFRDRLLGRTVVMKADLPPPATESQEDA